VTVTFDEVPPIEVRLLTRPNDPSLGAGEATIGPVSVALAKGLGKRYRQATARSASDARPREGITRMTFLFPLIGALP
jgi:hypothetical protein